MDSFGISSSNLQSITNKPEALARYTTVRICSPRSTQDRLPPRGVCWVTLKSIIHSYVGSSGAEKDETRDTQNVLQINDHNVSSNLTYCTHKKESLFLEEKEIIRYLVGELYWQLVKFK